MTTNARANAKAWIERIVFLSEAITLADAYGNWRADAYRQEMEDMPLSVLVRGPGGGWRPAGEVVLYPPAEFEILLSTGGPALRVIGDLDAHGNVDNSCLQIQDWFTPWTDFALTAMQAEALEYFCSRFYFDEG